MKAKYRKLAVVVDTFPKWSERFIARELQELKRRGVDFTVFHFKQGTLPFGDDSEWEGLLNRSRLLPLSYGTIPIINRDVNSTTKAAGELERIVLNEGFEHIHSHFANVPSSVGRFAAMGANVPYSISVHARDLFVEARELDAKIADASHIFTCHCRALEFLKARGATRVTCMHHGLPLDRFPFTDHGESERSKPKFIAVCRFVEKKGLQYVIEAMSDPRMSGSGAELELIGDGPEQKSLEKLVRKMNLESRIRFTPPMGSLELLTVFQTATALVAPYETAGDGDADGIPNVILEAFAAGLPVIGTGAGSLPEILTPETGTVVPERNFRLLAEAMAAAHRNIVPRKVAAARQLVERDFDIQKNLTPLLERISLKSAC